MKELKINKNLSSQKLKIIYNDLIFNDYSDEKIKLILPNELSKYRFGLFSEFIQLIVNLKSKIEIVQINIENTAEELKNLYDQEYIYPIVSLLWNISSFIDVSGNSIKKELRTYQNEFYTKMNSFSKLKSSKALLINIDHFSNNKGLIKLFENPEGFNEDEDQVIKTISTILTENILTFNKNNIKELNNVLHDIGAIVYELIKNTFEWGKSDINNTPISPSIRGLYLKFYNNNHENLNKEFKDTPLSSFFKNPKLIQDCKNPSTGNIYYLEITVFDSGVGFIDKFNNKEALSHIEIIKKCLIKNQTSSISNLKSKKGLGLDRILQTLDQKGLIKINTDKYSVYRDMLKDNYTPINNNNLNELVLEDWDNENFKSTIRKRIDGSFSSILYPFKSN